MTAAWTARAGRDVIRPGWIWGEVRTADNEPAPNAAVAIVREEDGQTEPPALETTTDDKGRYVIKISSLSPGNYVVIVNPGPTMAGGHQGGQTTLELDNPANDSKRLDWTLTANPPVLPVPPNRD
jgi:hypothetical protein